MSEREPTEQEKREAEALARALEGDGSSGDIPEDALETAGLLRVSGEQAGLDDRRMEAILDKVQGTAAPAKKAFPWLRMLVPAGGLAAVAIVALTMVAGRPVPAPLPRPGQDLLEAQAGAAAGKKESVAALQSRMRKYRREMYDSLARHYEG